ncbi:MAG: endolytic transglycosylase MltG [Gammaproteobacteria bacterium]|nr:endolytic transglycosylase MltG [Gammaproteobacteria bacterium]
MKSGVSRAVTIIVTVVVVAVVAVVGGRRLATWAGSLGRPTDVTASSDIQAGAPVTIEVPAGSSARQIGIILAENGVVSSALAFELAVRGSGEAERLQAGTYQLETGMTAGDALNVLLRGPVVESYRVTVPEGLWVTEILDSLAAQTVYDREDFESGLSNVHSSHGYGGGGLDSWEGGLFPDTYEFAPDASAEEILQRMATTMDRRIESVDWSGLEAQDFTVKDGVIIASMIEAEAKLDEDRPLIASVVLNRLEIGMPLQIDATVLYALAERGKVLSSKDLEVDSPYNTYRVQGLPPTPIGAPGLASLEAAAHPAESKYLYYVLTDKAGGHSFAATYDEFLALKAQAKRDGVIP